MKGLDTLRVNLCPQLLPWLRYFSLFYIFYKREILSIRYCFSDVYFSTRSRKGWKGDRKSIPFALNLTLFTYIILKRMMKRTMKMRAPMTDNTMINASETSVKNRTIYQNIMYGNFTSIRYKMYYMATIVILKTIAYM